MSRLTRGSARASELEASVPIEKKPATQPVKVKKGRKKAVLAESDVEMQLDEELEGIPKKELPDRKRDEHPGVPDQKRPK
ncbi:hypothetical protein BDZ97DRAFT_1930872 [Flammula alnicola]|nr:hypothetical protein BDZ97DRAFT_1930872 [Flammula alnicola]